MTQMRIELASSQEQIELVQFLTIMKMRVFQTNIHDGHFC